MKFIVASKEDTASMNIRRFVVEDGDWRAFGRFEGEPVLRSGQDALLVTIEDTHLYYDDIDRKVSEALGLPMPELVIFLSRHKSGSGLRTLTVHPLGCYHKADYGGRDGTLVPAAPVHMTKALRSINERTISEGLDFQVSYECTHHGPYLESPTFFIEIGRMPCNILQHFNHYMEYFPLNNRVITPERYFFLSHFSEEFHCLVIKHTFINQRKTLRYHLI